MLNCFAELAPADPRGGERASVDEAVDDRARAGGVRDVPGPAVLARRCAPHEIQR